MHLEDAMLHPQNIGPNPDTNAAEVMCVKRQPIRLPSVRKAAKNQLMDCGVHPCVQLTTIDSINWVQFVQQ
jgi:hypothetical protein